MKPKNFSYPADWRGYWECDRCGERTPRHPDTKPADMQPHQTGGWHWNPCGGKWVAKGGWRLELDHLTGFVCPGGYRVCKCDNTPQNAEALRAAGVEFQVEGEKLIFKI